jgi:copper transport protein
MILNRRRSPAVRLLIFVVLSLWLMVSGQPTMAHANLVRTEPPPNSILPEAPQQIRLWLTEPAEPDFSRVRLRDAGGDLVEIGETQIMTDDPRQVFANLPELADGLYTVSWRVLSAADGHPTTGSFAFVVGDAAAAFASQSAPAEQVPAEATLIRWLNLISLSLGIGGIGFWLFVWTPSVTARNAETDGTILWLTTVGWLLIGLSGALLLLLQYAAATDNPLLVGLSGPALQQLITETRFGELWLIRTALWVGLGLALYFARGDRWFWWVALGLGLALLLAQSFFSHASAAQEQIPAVGADWLHLSATVLWVGGLLHLIGAIPAARRGSQGEGISSLSLLVGHFSNFARVAVAALALTGLFATWLQVGSVEGLTGTLYGRALLFKLALFAPVIGLAAVNLLVTARRLRAGEAIWASRLRGLVAVEIVLTLGILLAVGLMTSITPARNQLALLAAAPRPPEANPINATLTADDLTLDLEISPGWVGVNTFALRLTGADGQPVTNASLIRMRFESQTQNLGESELRPAHQGEGLYTIEGANLSAPGDWRIRVTVQRPDQFDALTDFRPAVPTMPFPVQPPPLDPNPALMSRVVALAVAGVAVLLMGGYFLGENRLRAPYASSLLALGAIALGANFLVSSGGLFLSQPAPDRPAFATDAPIRMAVTSQPGPPYLVTQDGRVLQPGADGRWTALPFEGVVSDVKVDVSGTVWVAADTGSYALQEGAWQPISDRAARRLEIMHGYLFALESDGLTRAPAGGLVTEALEPTRRLPLPDPDQLAQEMVMLGSHGHVLLDGDQVYLTADLGESWQPLYAPQAVTTIAPDVDGNLLVGTASYIFRWRYTENRWTPDYPPPGDDEAPLVQAFNDTLYALGAGRLWRWEDRAWQPVELPEANGAYLTQIISQFPQTLWVLDSAGNRLWSSEDGQAWQMTPIAR